MKEIVLWEHGHAYQPRRLIDSVDQSPREVRGTVHIQRKGVRMVGRNWFELMLRPGGVYDLLVEAASGRSIDMEPLTLHHLKNLNPQSFESLREKALTGRTYMAAAPYSHPILPILAEASPLDALVNVVWGLRFHQQTFGEALGDGTIAFWLSECAYSKEAVKVVLKAVGEVFGDGAKVLFLLDELQSEGTEQGMPYATTIDSERVFVVFRSRWLSDAYAFSPKYEGIMNTLKGVIGSGKPGVIGVIIDAETYGGAYEAHKPALLERLHTELKDGVTVGDELYRFGFKTIDEIFKEAHGLQEAKIRDYTAWSDYEDHQIFRTDHPKTGTIVSERAGGLCRWTGHLRDGDGKPVNETYFMVFEWAHPKTKRRYVRVLSSLWKVAFNEARRRCSDIVRQAALETLRRFTNDVTAEEMMKRYGDIVFEKEGPEKFVKRHLTEATNIERKAAELILQAYRYTNQDAAMSCPTFWQNLDTEVSWTSLSYVAGGMALAARACLGLGDGKRSRWIAEEYQRVFMDFEETFRHLIDGYEIPLNLLYAQLREVAQRRGYDVEDDMARVEDGFEERAEEIARRLYTTALGGLSGGKPFLVADANKHIILWRIYERMGLEEEAGRAYQDAKLYEWKKSLTSAVSTTPLPTRVGVVHAKHFPDYGHPLRLLTEEVETETEIIIGEAHAHDP